LGLACHQPEVRAVCGRIGLTDDLEAVAAIEWDVVLILSFQVAGETDCVGLTDDRLQQSAADPLTLEWGVHPD
jgi:hypothetical protein